MFSVFPCSWNLPRRKPIQNLANHHFPPRTIRISRPVPEPVKAPAKIEKPKDNFACSDIERIKHLIPPEELCLGEAPVDMTEIDQMLKEIENPSQDARARQMMQMISTINQQLDKNIKIIQNAPSFERDTVSRDDLLRLLQMFKNYSKTLEDYLKNINQETKPSLR